MLTFDRISPDGFWPIFNSRLRHVRRSLLGHNVADDLQTFRYSDGSIVTLQDSQPDDTVRLTSRTPLSKDTYSHLNSYCVFTVTKHSRASLVFSPCPESPIEVLPADYPTGRPARFAYLNEAGLFSVVQASSGEKGPFETLASGIMSREDPLTITVCDDCLPMVEISLKDWARQSSTELSPTAGWQVAMNSVEFQRLDDAPDSTVKIWVTLAATSVGRGYDTVGHKQGTYRSRIEFRPLSLDD